jgi:hypothetical protein
MIRVGIRRNEKATRAHGLARGRRRESIRDPTIAARVVRTLGGDGREEHVTLAVELPQLLALKPTVKCSPASGSVPGGAVMRPDDVKVDRLIGELA